MSLRYIGILAVLATVLCFQNLPAQGSNPFEIRSFPKTLSASDSSDLKEPGPGINPLDLRPSIDPPSSGEQVRKNELLSWIKEDNPYYLSIHDIKSLLFWSLLFLSFLLAIALNINRSVTLKLYRSLVNLNFLALLYRESRDESRLIYFLLYGLYFIGISIFIYLAIVHYQGIKAPVYILYIAGFIVVAHTMRHLVLNLIAYTYGLQKQVEHYLFSIIIFSCILSVLLVPADFVISFVNPVLADKLIWIVAISIFIMFIYRQLRELMFSFNLWSKHLVHFLLYLCTFEIAPIAIIYVYLSRQGLI